MLSASSACRPSSSSSGWSSQSSWPWPAGCRRRGGSSGSISSMPWRDGDAMSMMGQIGAVTLMNLRSVPQRLGTSLVIVVGIAGVVAVLISVLAMATGFRQTVAGSGRANRAIVLRGGSNSELSSTLSRDATLTILDAPGIRRGDNGRPVGSAEAVVIVELPKKGSNSGANVTLRGVGSQILALRPEIRLVAGRMFQPALHELIVG